MLHLNKINAYDSSVVKKTVNAIQKYYEWSVKNAYSSETLENSGEISSADYFVLSKGFECGRPAGVHPYVAELVVGDFTKGGNWFIPHKLQSGKNVTTFYDQNKMERAIGSRENGEIKISSMVRLVAGVDLTEDDLPKKGEVLLGINPDYHGFKFYHVRTNRWWILDDIANNLNPDGAQELEFAGSGSVLKPIDLSFYTSNFKKDPINFKNRDKLVKIFEEVYEEWSSDKQYYYKDLYNCATR